jgi:hypothetical protein
MFVSRRCAAAPVRGKQQPRRLWVRSKSPEDSPAAVELECEQCASKPHARQVSALNSTEVAKPSLFSICSVMYKCHIGNATGKFEKNFVAYSYGRLETSCILRIDSQDSREIEIKVMITRNNQESLLRDAVMIYGGLNVCDGCNRLFSNDKPIFTEQEYLLRAREMIRQGWTSHGDSKVRCATCSTGADSELCV